MSFLLMLFLTLVCLALGHYPAPPWPAAPAQTVLLTTAAVAMVGLHAFWVSRRVSWPLDRDPLRRDDLLASYDRWRFLHQVVQFGVFGVTLGVFGWGWLLQQSGPLGVHGAELLLLLPFLLGQALTWLFFYDADRAAHQAAYRLIDLDPFGQTCLEARQASVPPFGGRWAYVAFQTRQKLALVFVPILMLIVYQEVGRLVPNAYDHWAMNLLVFAGLGAVFVGMPLILRLALGLNSLPPGPLRDRLEAATARLGFRCSDVLLWNTRSGMANAMVVGLVPWLRYIVFTDRLLEEFTPEEVEAVFGHEAGHVRHQHMLFYLAFLVASMLVLIFASNAYLPPLMGLAGEAAGEPVPEWVPSALVVAALLTYIFAVFGYLSRRCERQSDVFGCRAVSCGDVGCVGHDEGTPLAARGAGLCPTGIRMFIRALDKVALVNGISRERPGFFQSWQHSTIARRVDFLRGVLGDARREAAFQRRLRVVKAGLMFGLAAAAAALWWAA